MAVKVVSDSEFSQELIDFIYEWKGKPGNLIMILHKLQQEKGFVPRESAIKLSEMIEVPLAKIYGVITFYHFFKMEKPGENTIQVCMGTACYLKGAQDLLDGVHDLLGTGDGSASKDGKFSVESVRCIGCCGLAPVITVNGEVFGKVEKNQLADIVAKY